MAKKKSSGRRVYKRDKDGKFAVVGSGRARSARTRNKDRNSGQRKRSAGENRLAKKIALRNRKDGSGARKKANVNQKAIRRERNKEALAKLRARGVKIPKGSLAKVAQLKKGQSVRLSNGLVIKRSKSGTYSASKAGPVKKKKKG
jgi:hypothetical protein